VKQKNTVNGDRIFMVEELLSVAADYYRRYQGEPVNLKARLDLSQVNEGNQLEAFIPNGLAVNDYSFNLPELVTPVGLSKNSEGQSLRWELAKDSTEPLLTLETKLTVLPVQKAENLKCLFNFLTSSGELIEQRGVEIFVSDQSKYINFLPEIYRVNDFTGRFLMLFESFLEPVSAQVNGIENYFDPDLTPPEFLPWLASWIGISWDVPITDERKRVLLRKSLQLFQSRGTKDALKEFLEIYTGGKAEITEHKTRNMKLGKQARLGHTIALGKRNLPHTFSVDLAVPSEVSSQFKNLPPDRAEALYRQMVVSLINTQKPAHTACDLSLHFIDEAALSH
jgi:phage tail-like protein